MKQIIKLKNPKKDVTKNVNKVLKELSHKDIHVYSWNITVNLLRFNIDTGLKTQEEIDIIVEDLNSLINTSGITIA